MSRPGFDEVVLLTGYPSFSARKICEEILLSPKTLVHAVVRSKSTADAMAALDTLPLDQRRRVNLLEGDAAAMDLGLSGKELGTIVKEVDRIHHAAEVSYLGVDTSMAEQINVVGAREILEIAEACSDLKCLVFHSTAAVSGDRAGFVKEDELDKQQGFRNVVEQTKARAERMMRAAMPRVPIAVVRPSIVVGDSQTGEVDRFDGPYILILLMVTSPPDFALPLPGRGDSPLHLVPIDYVAKAARAIGLDPRSPGRTFHIVDPHPLTARHIFELVARAGGRRLPRGFIPANLTKALLRTPGLDRFAKSPRAFLDALATPVVYGTANTDEVLAGTGIQCPPFESYVERLVEFVQVRLREKREKKLADRELEDPLG
ncbi:SDR family oxidoreductase [Pendulispora albinea]|uniref:SDR family oxidoreductase n=1 Tax=Pendulispora albinea TaxID=2741071 RepID=A0ABZ2M674_9BACT